nr:ribonuclease H-like domain-containing protein [Tanacetum cinerariifolium]
MTYTILNMFNGVEVSKLNMTVGHPNGTKVVVTYVGSLWMADQIVIHDVLVVPGYEDSIIRTQVATGNENNGLDFLNTVVYLINKIPSYVLSRNLPYELLFNVEPNLSHLKSFGCLSFYTILNDSTKFSSSAKFKKYEMVFQNKNGLNFFNSDEDESKSSEPNEDVRDIGIEKSKETTNTPLGGTENTESTVRNESNTSKRTLEEVVSDVDDIVILEKKDSESEGDDSFYQEFNEMFETPNVVPDSRSAFNTWRSSRKTSIPKKLGTNKMKNLQ